MTSDASPATDDRNPVDILADEFAARLRRGESPSMQEYVERYPQHASEIEELFPGVALLEQLSEKQESEASATRVRQHSLPAGHRFGDIEIVREIGRGGMGIVYEAYQHSLSRAVAVKAITASAVHSPNQATRFQREAQAAAQLHHTNIVPVFGVGEQDGVSYYVMQLIHGQGLDAVLTELARKARGKPRPSSRLAHAEDETAATDSFSARELADVLVSGELSESVSGAAHRPVRDRDATVLVDHALPAQGGQRVLEHRAEDRTEDRTGEIGEVETPQTYVHSSVELRDDVPSAPGVRSSLILRDQPASAESFPGPASPAPAPAPDPALASLGPRYWRNIARIGVQVASGLQYAHSQGTLHRDIKPANILLDTEGTAWIADFGLAKVLQQEDVTRTGDVVGTLRYMAPEQFRGETDGRSDIYSLGLTLYELLTLRPAYEETDRQKLIAQKLTPNDPPHPRKLHPAIPRDLETIVLKCLAWEPDGRYATSGGLLSDLQAFLDDRPINARRISSGERFWRWCRRNPVVAGLSTAVAVLLLMGATLATYGYLRERDRAETFAALTQEAEQSAREAEQLADVQWDALNRIYETFVPERFAAPVEASADADDESGLESESTAPVLSPQTAALLEEMLLTFDRIATIRGTDERYLEETARANRKVGDLHLRLGQHDEAAEAFERAIERYRKLQDIRGFDSETSVLLARMHNGLGITYQHRGESGRARMSLGTSLAILNSPKIDKSDRDVRRETAATYYLLGRRPPRGAPSTRRPSERHDGSNDRDRSEGTSEVAGSPSAPGDATEVRTAASRRGERGNQSSEIQSSKANGPPAPAMPFAVNAAPGSGNAPSPRGGERDRGSRGRGRSEHRSGGWEFEENYSHLQQAVAILDSLIEEYPAVPEYQFLDALCHIELSDSRLLPDDVSGDEMLDRAVDILTTLVNQHPEEPDYLYQLSEAHEQRYYRWKHDFRPLFLQEYPGFMQRIVPDERRTDLTGIDRAEQDLQHAVRLSTTLMRLQPNVARYAESHRSLLFNLADVEVVQGDTVEARRLLDESNQLQQMISLRFPQADDSSWHRRTFQEMLQAQVLVQSGQSSKALDMLQQILDRSQSSGSSDEQRWFGKFRRDLQRSIYGMLAAAHEQLGNIAAADAARRAADDRRADSGSDSRGRSGDDPGRGATN